MPPKASDKARKEADQMIEQALNQVPNAGNFDTKRKEIEVTLFAGNLDFGAYAEDVIESLQYSWPGVGPGGECDYATICP